MNKGTWLFSVLILIGAGIGAFLLLKGPSTGSGPAAPGAGAGMSGGGGSSSQDQMAQFREAHKFTFEMTKLVGNIGRLDNETDTPLTTDQATKILAVLEPLRKTTSMSQDEAKDTMKALQTVLTPAQVESIGKLPDRRGQGGPGGGGGQAGGGGGQGGPGGASGGGPGGASGGGQRPRFDPAVMQNFNPFNPPAGSPMAQRSAKRWDRFFTALHDRAAGKPAVRKTEDQLKAERASRRQGPPPAGGGPAGEKGTGDGTPLADKSGTPPPPPGE